MKNFMACPCLSKGARERARYRPFGLHSVNGRLQRQLTDAAAKAALGLFVRSEAAQEHKRACKISLPKRLHVLGCH
jgi:hypothetical protein